MLERPQQGGSNEYPQSMFLSRNKKINVYPSKLQFYCIKVGFKGGCGGGGGGGGAVGGSKLQACFRDVKIREPD